MLKKITVVAAASIVALMLAGCEENGKVPVATILPHVPAKYRVCAETVLLPKGEVSRSDVVKLVADLRKSEVSKSACIKGLIAWYDNVRVSYARKK
jgi:uncharacterized protein YcfL